MIQRNAKKDEETQITLRKVIKKALSIPVLSNQRLTSPSRKRHNYANTRRHRNGRHPLMSTYCDVHGRASDYR